MSGESTINRTDSSRTGRAISTNLLCDSNGRWSGLPQPVDCLADSEAGMELLAVGRLAALCVLHQCHAPLQLHSTVWQLLTSSSISLRQLWPDREGFYEGFIAKVGLSTAFEVLSCVLAVTHRSGGE